jgi:prevent-host-death family protein
MDTVNIPQVKTNLSQLLQCVELGEEITIANRGVPVVELVPISATIDRHRCRISLKKYYFAAIE